MNKLIVVLILMCASTPAYPQTRTETFHDSIGRATGKAVTDTHGNTTYYDNIGRRTGNSTTHGNTTTFYDNIGRQQGTAQKGK
jgi:hypothetical protein